MPGVTTTIHRHSWDAILFMVAGSGWTEIDGVRYDWKPWDAIHIPAWAWHRHGNERRQAGASSTLERRADAREVRHGLIEDGGHAPVAELPPGPASCGGSRATIRMRGGRSACPPVETSEARSPHHPPSTSRGLATKRGHAASS